MIIPFPRREFGPAASEPFALPSSIQSSASVLFMTFLYPAKSLIRNGLAILDKPAERLLDVIISLAIMRAQSNRAAIPSTWTQILPLPTCCSARPTCRRVSARKVSLSYRARRASRETIRLISLRLRSPTLQWEGGRKPFRLLISCRRLQLADTCHRTDSRKSTRRAKTRSTFKWLQASYEGRAVWMSYLAVDPVFDGYRSNERFQDLLRRVHLLQ
jgi:hypothetical protein